MPEHTTTNCEILAEHVIEMMSIAEMEQILYDMYMENFEDNEEAFDTAWEVHFG